MVNRSKGKALEPSTKRLENPEKETLADARESVRRASEGNRPTNYWPAADDRLQLRLLHAAIIWRLLAANEGLASSAQPNAQPIHRIHPRRFEIIIDLNLEYPGGRDAAGRRGRRSYRGREAGGESRRRWAANSIRERPTKQPVFIRATRSTRYSSLIDLDMEAAKSEVENYSFSGIALTHLEVKG